MAKDGRSGIEVHLVGSYWLGREASSILENLLVMMEGGGALWLLLAQFQNQEQIHLLHLTYSKHLDLRYLCEYLAQMLPHYELGVVKELSSSSAWVVIEGEAWVFQVEGHWLMVEEFDHQHDPFVQVEGEGLWLIIQFCPPEKVLEVP